MLTKELAVVAGVHHDRVFRQAGFIQRLQQTAYQMIHIGYHAQIDRTNLTEDGLIHLIELSVLSDQMVEIRLIR